MYFILFFSFSFFFFFFFFFFFNDTATTEIYTLSLHDALPIFLESGVIIGPDLVARHGRTVTMREANKDPEFKKRSVTDLQYDRHIRNIYKVLLTRGMVGTIIYAVDPQTQEFLAELIETPTWRAAHAPEAHRVDAKD